MKGVTVKVLVSEKETIKVALIGNPNVGKTLLFNDLTGGRAHVGNWPGKTVEKKEGKYTFRGVKVELVDLPGTYSLTAHSVDELIAREFIVNEKPDVVIDIVDASNLERNLYLTMQLLELGANVVIALNKFDLAEGLGYQIDVKALASSLGVRVVPTVATTKKGVEELKQAVIEAARKKPSKYEVSYGRALDSVISKVEEVIVKDPTLSRFPSRWLAVKALEKDEEVLKLIRASPHANEIEKVVAEASEKLGDDPEVVLAEKRYEIIGSILSKALEREEKPVTFSDLIDRVLLNKYLGIPIFAVILWAMFTFTFEVSAPLSDLIDLAISWLGEVVNEALTHADTISNMFFIATGAEINDFLANLVAGWLPSLPEWSSNFASSLIADWMYTNLFQSELSSLITDGVISGVGAVLVFIPPIFFLFFALSILEDSGYLARAAFVVDRILYKAGLHGKSFIPLLLGFGCNIPGVMATRSIDSEEDRILTILVNPLMSCNARLPVYVLVAGAVLGAYATFGVFSMYVLGMVLAASMALLFRRTIPYFKKKPSHFIMELPTYALPTARNTLTHMWERGYVFVRKAGTIIVAGVVAVWYLSTHPWGLPIYWSHVATIGYTLEPIFRPLGFNWMSIVALVFGFVAKEMVVGTFGVLLGCEEEMLGTLLASYVFTPVTGLAFMAFTLIYIPCLATIGIIYRETASWKWTAFTVVYGIILAYLVALLIVSVGHLLGVESVYILNSLLRQIAAT
nr:ferrous iron transport protein B [Candidatus Bathyarchaeota archaeon]